MTGGATPGSFDLDDDGNNANLLSNTQALAAIVDGSEYVVTEAEAAVRKALAPAQLHRLREIAWQVWGPMAFSDPDVVAALKLTPQQREQVAATQTSFKAAERRSFERRA